MKWIYFYTFIIAYAAGVLAFQFQMVLPWLLGPLIITAVVNHGSILRMELPLSFRNAGLIIIGASIGTAFTKDSFTQMAAYFPFMLGLTILISAFSLWLGWGMSKWTGWNLETTMLGSLPGGLSQMVLWADEMEVADTTAVTIMHSIRLFFVLTFVPAISSFIKTGEPSPLPQEAEALLSLPAPALLMLAGLVSVTVLGFLRLKLALPFLLGPIIAVVCWNLLGGETFHISGFPLHAAQVILGVYLGMKMNISKKTLPARNLGLLIVTNGGLVAFCLGLAALFSSALGLSFIDLFISLAPGGVAEMAVTAMASGADIAVVTSFHLFRVFFILFLLAPLTAYFLKKR